ILRPLGYNSVPKELRWNLEFCDLDCIGFSRNHAEATSLSANGTTIDLMRRVCLSVVLCSLIAAAGQGADDRIDYLKQVKPVLTERCLACHGALKQEAGLRLDTAA